MSLGDIFYSVTKMGATAYIAGFFMCFFALVTSSIRRMPRRVTYLMLFLVIFRMVCPVSIPSRWSVLNIDLAVEFADNYSLVELLENPAGDYEVAVKGTDAYQEAIDAGLTPDEESNYAVFYTFDEQGSMVSPKSVKEVYGSTCAIIWLSGVALFWGYGVVSYLVLKRRVATATLVEDNVYESDRIQTPFILGFLHPKIYLPLGLSEPQRRYVLCHEREHIRHGDHILKALVYAIMSVHWFAWFLWLYFYRMFTCELELACDSDVLRSLGEEHKTDYSESLLSLSERKHFIGAVPCAFGESHTKERVKRALTYKTPTAFWTALSVILLILATIVTCTNPL